MPEGDTVHAVAQRLTPDLVGHVLTHLEAHQRPVPWGPGARCRDVQATGKHLFVFFDTTVGPRFVRVHLGMKGSWHRYRPGEGWARDPSGRRLVIATSEWWFVCFGPKEVEVGTRPTASHLGPDLLGDFDLDRVIANARAPRLDLGDLLLTQTVASGIGNVYKSETLFIERLDPWRAADSIDDATLRRVYLRAQTLMQLNVAHGGPRTTLPPNLFAPTERYWVYRRAAMPCRVCHQPILSRLQGDMARMTYWCSTCQQ